MDNLKTGDLLFSLEKELTDKELYEYAEQQIVITINHIGTLKLQSFILMISPMFEEYSTKEYAKQLSEDLSDYFDQKVKNIAIITG